MCGGPIGYRVRFPHRQKLPDGYEVWGEWGEGADGEASIGWYTWTDQSWTVVSKPFATRWEARRDAIRHASGPNRLPRAEA